MTRRSETIDALASAPKDLRRLAKRFPDTPDGAAASILNHMLGMERRARERFRQVAAGEAIGGFDFEPALAGPDPAELVLQFERERQKTIALLEGFSLGDWQKKTIIENGPQETLRTLVQQLVAHDTEQLNRLLSAKE